jgi:hypothetical protein
MLGVPYRMAPLLVAAVVLALVAAGDAAAAVGYAWVTRPAAAALR